MTLEVSSTYVFLMCTLFSFSVGGLTYTPGQRASGYNEVAVPTSLVTMEADLRSSNASERTVRWFVDNRQQPVFVSGLPPTVEFGVCGLIFFSTLLCILFSLSFVTKVLVLYLNSSKRFQSQWPNNLKTKQSCLGVRKEAPLLRKHQHLRNIKKHYINSNSCLKI